MVNESVLMCERKLVQVLSLLVAFALIALSCGEDGADRRAPSAPENSPEIQLEAVATGLEIPWAMAFAPDGRFFVTERPGRIRVVDADGLRPEPWAELDVVPPDYRTEGGLLGIALAPDFETTGHVFVVGTFLNDGRLANRVLRFTDRDGQGADRTVVIEGLPEIQAEPGSEPAIHTHLGGGLAFGPDGMLYVTTGDATRPELAQDPNDLAGKILRYRPDGSVPADNPTPGSPVYAMGLRNPQGLTWHPETGDLFVTDHGPSELSWETNYGGWFGDELNAVVAGANYGWPRVVGMGPLGRYVDPLVEWSPSIAPASVAVYSGSRFPWQRDILVASLRGQRLWRITLERNETLPTGWKAVRREGLMEGRIGRIRVVTMGLDGHLYIASSNRDSRGKPRMDDDCIYRVTP
ncbi:MAG: PQQ-dependent sugar dehydrogenase [Acidobacteriota bacterium]|nr:MAG: PQQ-dependent sugar dehydrogenase [Acidobacteriota bacterium]